MSGPDRGAPERAVVAEALSWVGTPYRHQASRKHVGCDCLGLVRGVWRALYGTEPETAGPYSMDWAETGGGERLLEAARRHFLPCPAGVPAAGRLVLFRWRPHLPAKHAGILVAEDAFVHAYEGRAVVVSSLVPQWRRRIAGVFTFPRLTER
ncbi:NlpC/P60 family protein [Chelativorans intermedius]|uniref:NlpC/P60 family protein n=1 Tax=Chelativorans intermedius TaxID=515947 RepID=A0ABV6DC23_9HYPH|nr:NlpC/P60 family protein [Chelativorans intermedius]MCT8999651.1 NlpC/P60 family protein [Chelativorans intermedius]